MKRGQTMNKFETGSLAVAGGLAVMLSCPTAMAQDECSTALPLAPGAPVQVDTTVATGSAEAVDAGQCLGTFLAWGDPLGNPDVWLVWTAKEAGLAAFSTCDPDGFDTSMVVYTGSCGDLTQLACNGDTQVLGDCQQYYSLIENVVIDAGATYYVRVGGYASVAGVTTVSMSFEKLSASCNGAEGDCGVVHETPGCNDGACCEQVCAFAPFCCEVEWDEFCVESAIKTCGIYQYECPAGGPVNNCPTSPIVVASGDVVAFDTTLADTVGPEENCGSSGNDLQIHSDLWYRFSAKTAGTLVASTCSTADFDTKIALYDIGDGIFDPNELPELFVACNEDGPCKFFTSLLTVALDAGTTYLVRLGGFGFETGSGTISFEFVPDAASCGEPDAGTCCEAQAGPFCAEGDCCEAVCAIDPACCDELWDASCADLAFTACTPLCGTPPANDECEGAIPLVLGANFVENVNASTGPIQPPAEQCTFFGSSTINNDVWFTYTSACDGPVILSFCPGNGGSATFDTKLAVWSGPDCDNLSIVGCNDDTCGTRSEVLFDAVCGEVYLIQFGAWASQGQGTGELVLSCAGDSCDNPADINGDGVVDGADLTILLAAWGTDNALSDLNGDGIVDGADLTILLAAWS